MNNYYEQLNRECKKIAVEAIKDNSILSDNMLKKEESEFLLSDWNAFLIALICDQSVKAEMAWRLPYLLSKRLGHFNLYRIAKEENVESLERLIKEKPALHRYPRKMAEYIMFAIEKIGNDYHIPVLYYETLDNLVINPDGVYIDCTLGGGSHSEGILERLSDRGLLLSIDQDSNAIEYSKKRLEKYASKWKVLKGNFENIDTLAYMAGIDKVDGILMDIGVSSKQLDEAERGFSYRYDVKLDMRMNTEQKLSAYDVVNTYSEEELSRIIFEYGEERFARKIAKLICENRKIKPITTTFELVALIRRAYPERASKHPAKKTFQAIRIEVNRELEVLENAMSKAVELLKVGGRLGIITFHSLEDRIVKNKFKDLATACKCPKDIPICMCGGVKKFEVITRKPIIPVEDELKNNNRAHSSKLRILERILD